MRLSFSRSQFSVRIRNCMNKSDLNWELISRLKLLSSLRCQSETIEEKIEILVCVASRNVSESHLKSEIENELHRYVTKSSYDRLLQKFSIENSFLHFEFNQSLTKSSGKQRTKANSHEWRQEANRIRVAASKSERVRESEESEVLISEEMSGD